MSIVQKTIKKFTKNVVPEQIKVALRSTKVYRQKFGHYPNIIVPKGFNEKVVRRKIFDRDPRLPLLADKVLVKQFVSDRLGSEFIIPTLWHGAKLPPREQRIWQKPFAMKANHGSGWNIFVQSEADCDWDSIEQRFAEWMPQLYGHYAGEWLYGQIPPQILIEPFIGDVASMPTDYKFWTFNGKARFVQVDTDRQVAHKRVFYDLNWKRLPFALEFPLDEREIARPVSLETMISFAESLAGDIQFARVDFYELNERPLFGEMTFYPGSGCDRFSSDEHDLEIGALWR